eukprot:569773-Pelagomonas_calceolata.AAC.2
MSPFATNSSALDRDICLTAGEGANSSRNFFRPPSPLIFRTNIADATDSVKRRKSERIHVFTFSWWGCLTRLAVVALSVGGVINIASGRLE